MFLCKMWYWHSFILGTVFYYNFHLLHLIDPLLYFNYSLCFASYIFVLFGLHVYFVCFFLIYYYWPSFPSFRTYFLTYWPMLFIFVPHLPFEVQEYFSIIFPWFWFHMNLYSPYINYDWSIPAMLFTNLAWVNTKYLDLSWHILAILCQWVNSSSERPLLVVLLLSFWSISLS